MMPFYFPNFRGNYPPNYQPYNNYNNRQSIDKNITETPYAPKNFNSNNYHNTYINKNNITKEEQESNSRSSNDFVNLFGIRLASDDLIILGLLFFLYNEKVDDTFLFIALIMLLLS